MRILILILLILIFIFEFNNLTHEIPTKKDVSSNDAQVLKAQSINKNNSNIEKKNKLLFETVENGQGLLIPSLDINDLLQNGVLKYLDVTGNKEHIIDNWKVVNNDISTSYLSSVEINDFNQPLTITVTDNELYMTLPLFSGVFSARPTRIPQYLAMKSRGTNPSIVGCRCFQWCLLVPNRLKAAHQSIG